MRVHEPPTETVDSDEITSRWRQLLIRVAGDEVRVIIEEKGDPVAALVPLRDLNRLAALEAQRRELFQPLAATRAAFADVPPEEIEREVARAIADVRRTKRERKPQTSDPA